MLISLNWLNDYIDIKDIDPQIIADHLTNVGLEVEGVNNISSISGKVVVGEILTSEKHPNADSLLICKVNIGEDSPLEVVCGAQNATIGKTVCVAKSGSTIANGIKLKKSKIRGIISNGMILAEDELGISNDHSEIIELSKDIPIGTSVADLFGLKDTVLDISITPNRADCLSYIGIARELSACLDLPLMTPNINYKVLTPNFTCKDKINIEIKNKDLCPRFCAIYITDLNTHRSPLWMRQRLEASGMRPINLIVDITNYVMLEYGQPIHAYDERFVNENTIIVRNAKSSEKLQTLDEKIHSLCDEDLVISDPQKAIGLAGVMGGANSEIKDDTKAIILEVAYFSPPSIRKTSKKYGFHTEASHRFERGVNIDALDKVAKRVAKLLQAITDETNAKENINLPIPKATADLIDFYPDPVLEKQIALRISRTRKIIGLTTIKKQDIISHLKPLNIDLVDSTDDRLLFNVPMWRSDIQREIDLIEEVGRTIGFDKIPYKLPVMEIKPLSENPFISFSDNAKKALAGCGFNEIISFPFISEKDLKIFNINSSHPYFNAIKIQNPLVEEKCFMQTSLIFNLVFAAMENRKQGVYGTKLFECSRGYYGLTDDNKINKDNYSQLAHLNSAPIHLTPKAAKEKRPLESPLIAGILDQPFTEKNWQSSGKEAPSSFFHGKASVLSFLKYFGIMNVHFPEIDPKQIPFLNPKASSLVMVSDKYVGYIGEVHPRTSSNYNLDIEHPPVIFELFLNPLYLLTQSPLNINATLYKFPPATRDLALVVKKDIKHSDFIDALKKFPNKRNLKSYKLFDVYTGDNVPEGTKSMAYSLEFQSLKRTLNDREVDLEVGELIKWLETSLDAKLR